MNSHHLALWHGYILEWYTTAHHWIGVNIVRLSLSGLYECTWQGPIAPKENQ